MNAHVSNIGGYPVGHFADYSAEERQITTCLRLWKNGARAQARLTREFIRILGEPQGQMAADALDQFTVLLSEYGPRALTFHAVMCDCVGTDESLLVKLITEATKGAREDALRLSMVIIRPDMAPYAVQSARRYGVAMKRFSLLAHQHSHRG
ncbi:MAG: hypothetical protein ACPGVK_08915 [Halocynthiibacter sp.]